MCNKVSIESSTLFNVNSIIESLKDSSDNIYYAIEIYGNKNYILHNPYLNDIKELAGINLKNDYCTNNFEYSDSLNYCNQNN